MLVRRLSDAAVQDFHRLSSHILMDAGELDKEVEQFDEEFIADFAKPLTPQERTRHRRAKNKRRKADSGDALVRFGVALENKLFRRSMAYAKKHGLSPSALISLGLEKLLGKER